LSDGTVRLEEAKQAARRVRQLERYRDGTLDRCKLPRLTAACFAGRTRASPTHAKQHVSQQQCQRLGGE